MAGDDTELIKVYQLIVGFLDNASHTKAAKAVRKAAKTLDITDIKHQLTIPPTKTLPEILRHLASAEKQVASLQAELEQLKGSQPKTPKGSHALQEDSSQTTSSDSESDSPSSDEEPQPRAGIGAKRKFVEADLSLPAADDVIAVQRKKPKLEEATEEEVTLQNETSKKSKSITRFQRIKAHDVVYADDKLKDNTFESRGASTNDYGAKASADLIVTRGAGFRKEKNKKKRGSYRGGEITMQSYSIKFND